MKVSTTAQLSDNRVKQKFRISGGGKCFCDTLCTVTLPLLGRPYPLNVAMT
jgi:hypothetical protein